MHVVSNESPLMALGERMAGMEKRTKGLHQVQGGVYEYYD